jgi:RNase P protein component
MCPSSGETTVFMRHFVLVILDIHPYRITSTKCRINTVVSPDYGHIVARNMKRRGIRKIAHQVGFIYKTTEEAEGLVVQ